MLTFRLITSVTYLKQVSIYTTRLGNSSEQNQNLCTIINRINYLYNQNRGKWIDCVKTFANTVWWIA